MMHFFKTPQINNNKKVETLPVNNQKIISDKIEASLEKQRECELKLAEIDAQLAENQSKLDLIWKSTEDDSERLAIANKEMASLRAQVSADLRKSDADVSSILKTFRETGSPFITEIMCLDKKRMELMTPENKKLKETLISERGRLEKEQQNLIDKLSELLTECEQLLPQLDDYKVICAMAGYDAKQDDLNPKSAELAQDAMDTDCDDSRTRPRK